MSHVLSCLVLSCLPVCLKFQNLVKRDKEGYKDEFLQQQRNYLSELEIFKLKVSYHIMFICRKPRVPSTGRWETIK